ncbi:MAG TPA: sigma factor-like helix-turn-helix DNA-binding protein [Niabella sp.]|nr:sigma factor-like helix-turn-helix DNA-binding protein [Niabella sp.]HRO85610.1 sigma factor-like helix-turn-helix DNA-binding protein [Niabella sp.]HUN04300.1 sigma factor-like helix-turn-helix DNA-binding protein [Niabella sp.]
MVREEGMTYKQVGAILEISQNTIETHMRLALKDIKQLLDKYLTDKL